MKLFTFAASVGLTFAGALAHSQTICIDPGHPSENGVGTHGKHVSEVHAAWEVARLLVVRLNQAGYHVVMTKSKENEKVSNRRRAEIANSAHASLMVRLHCDAGSKSGFATYYPGAQGHVNNAVGPSKQVISRSGALAKTFHRAVIEQLQGQLGDRGCHTEAATMIGSKQGALTGSIYSKVPVLLVEMAVLQNTHDDLFISKEEGQAALAYAIEKGVEAAVPRRKS